MPVSLNNNVAQVTNAQPKKQPETKSETKSSISTGVKVAVGTGLVALAAVGIYVATRGKSAKTTGVADDAQEVVSTIKEMTVDAFKKAGNKFNKGKAVTSTGEDFTGKITSRKKDGTLVMRNYKDGLLDKVDFCKDNELLYSRIYKYDTKGLETIDKFKDVSFVSSPYTKTVGHDGLTSVYLNTDGRLRYVCYKERGMVYTNGHYYSPQNYTKGHFDQLYTRVVSLGALPEKNSMIINGHIFPDQFIFESIKNPGKFTPFLNIEYCAEDLKRVRKSDGINFVTSIDSNNANCEFIELDISGKFNNTSFSYELNKHDYGLTTLEIGKDYKNRKPICKYNLYTKEISDLKDEKEKEKVEQVIDFIERHYDSYKKALELELSEKEAALLNNK